MVMNLNNLLQKNKDIAIIIFIIIITFLSDLYWNGLIELIPAWDQGFHLSNLYRFANLLGESDIFQEDWWYSFWNITDNYRGPLSYIISGITIKIFGISLKNAILSNTVFNIITLFSIYIFCKKLFLKKLDYLHP